MGSSVLMLSNKRDFVRKMEKYGNVYMTAK